MFAKENYLLKLLFAYNGLSALNLAPRHEGIGGSEGIVLCILNSGTVALPQAERTPGTHWTGDPVGSRVDLDAVEKREKNELLLPGFGSRILGCPSNYTN
jgi:hypothetical protein